MPEKPPITLAFFAIPEEARPFQKILGVADAVRVIVTGIGPANASAAAHKALERIKPGCVLTCGFAGGLAPNLRAGTVLFETGEGMASLTGELSRVGARPARFLSAKRVAVTSREKKHLRDTTGADAVEMESGAIHACCQERRIPCATVRVISDAADENLPIDFNRVMTPDWRLSHARLALRLLAAPGRIPSLVRFHRQVTAAAESLAQVLSAVIPRD